MAGVRPLKTTGNAGEEFEEPINPNSDELQVRGIHIQGTTGVDSTVGLGRDGTNHLTLFDAVTGSKTLAQLAAGGSGVSEETHKALLQLIHFIDDGPAEGFVTGATKTTSYSGAFPTTETWRRADATKLVEKVTTYSGAFPATEEWKIYASDGTTVLATITDDPINYSGAFETSRERAIT